MSSSDYYDYLGGREGEGRREEQKERARESKRDLNITWELPVELLNIHAWLHVILPFSDFFSLGVHLSLLIINCYWYQSLCLCGFPLWILSEVWRRRWRMFSHGWKFVRGVDGERAGEQGRWVCGRGGDGRHSWKSQSKRASSEEGRVVLLKVPGRSQDRHSHAGCTGKREGKAGVIPFWIRIWRVNCKERTITQVCNNTVIEPQVIWRLNGLSLTPGFNSVLTFPLGCIIIST